MVIQYIYIVCALHDYYIIIAIESIKATFRTTNQELDWDSAVDVYLYDAKVNGPHYYVCMHAKCMNGLVITYNRKLDTII
jgi:hypothetical protein